MTLRIEAPSDPGPQALALIKRVRDQMGVDSAREICKAHSRAFRASAREGAPEEAERLTAAALWYRAIDTRLARRLPLVKK